MHYKTSEKKREYYRKWAAANPERVREIKRKWYAANIEKAREYYRKWAAANLEKKREANRKWRAANREKDREYSRKWRAANPEKKRETNKKWNAANPEYYRKYVKHRCATDPNFRLTKNLRTALCNTLQGRDKSASTMKIIGCTVEELFKHFESCSTWEPWMTRESYGRGGWDVDHIIPITKWDQNCPVQFAKCWHKSNLQPMEHIANIKKGAK
jgi:hypothetical protein